MFGNVLGRPLKLLDQMSIWNYTWKKFPVGEFYIMERILKVSFIPPLLSGKSLL